MTRKWKAAGVSVAAAVILTAASANADHPAGKGDTLNFGVDFAMTGFDPSISGNPGIPGANVQRMIYEDLFKQDKNGKLIPVLGTSVKASDDFKSWRVTLRKGVRYSNGEPFTAETYVLGIDRYLKSPLRGLLLGRTGPFTQAVAIDEHTVEFRFKQAFYAFADLAAVPNSYMWFNEPKHTRKLGKEVNRQPVGTGPYMLSAWRPGSTLTFVRNPNYWNPKAQHFDKIVIKIIKGQLPLMNTLRTAGIDMFVTPIGKTLGLAKNVKSVKFISNYAPGGGGGIWFNTSVTGLDDVRVRRALGHAVDRRVVTNIVQGPDARVVNDWWGEDSKWHCPNMGYPEFNPEKAKQLLKEYGKPVRFKLLTESSGGRLKVAQVHQTFWKRVGVEVELDPIQRGPAYRKKMRSGQFQAHVAAVLARVDPGVTNRFVHSKNKQNTLRIKEPEIDAALEAADRVTDPTKRRAAYCTYQKVVTKYLPQLYSWSRPASGIFRDYVKGLDITINNIINYQNAWFDGKPSQN